MGPLSSRYSPAKRATNLVVVAGDKGSSNQATGGYSSSSAYHEIVRHYQPCTSCIYGVAPALRRRGLRTSAVQPAPAALALDDELSDNFHHHHHDHHKTPATRETKQMSMATAINDALRVAMATDPSTIVLGEDVAFGGVFRCSTGLQREFGDHRVFNTPICERGFAGFAIGYAATGGTAMAEIELADYIFPAFDQIVNEAAKFRYRSGGEFGCGRLTIRAPYGTVGGGGHYHSQSPEAYFTHTLGLKVVIPRNPAKAKGLLLAAIRDPNPVLFFEPKALYEASEGDVSLGEYTERLGEAEVVKEGSDVAVLDWGAQMRVLEEAYSMAEAAGISCELVDLQTISPWDVATIEKSQSGGFAAEVASSIQERCFQSLAAPIQRICGYDTPFPLTLEKFYLPDALKNLDVIKRAVKF